MKLSLAQYRMLSRYLDRGVTSLSFGSTRTFDALVRRGYLRRSQGLGVIEAEITPEGEAALQQESA